MKTQQVYALLYNGTQHSEISGEFSLPDYLPDVRRILRVTSDPRITGKYMNGERLELEGEVGMSLIYLSEEQTICAFSASLPFSQSIAVSGLDETAVITARLLADSPVCRLTGPRKCVLRTRPTLRVRAIAQREISPDTSALTDVSRLCTRTESIPTADLICVNREELRYAEDIAITDGVISSVLSCKVTPIVKEYRTTAGHAVCKGDFSISALCSVITESGNEYRALHRSVPFSETLEDDRITDDCRCEPDLTIMSVTPTVTEEGHNLGIDFSCEAAVICAIDSTADIITDAYLPDCDVRIQGEQQTVFRPLKTVIGASSVSSTLRHDPQEKLKAVTDCSIHPVIDRCEHQNGRIILDGTLEISLICTTDDGKYQPLSGSAPLHWETDGTGLPEPANLLLLADCMPADAVSRIDPTANTVICDAELSVCLSVSAKEVRSLPRALVIPADSKAYTQPKEPLIYYYPEPNESVWSIAKRYRIPPQTVKNANRLDAKTDTVIGGTPLIIPIHPLFGQIKL